MGHATRTVVFASSNPHKVDEVRAILSPGGVSVIALDGVPLTRREDASTSPPRGEAGSAADLPEPVEDADTFPGNAAIKALYYARATGMVCLADDSGLEVDALGGRPGVLSARYSGLGSNRAERDAANNAKLLRELEGVPEARRTARFVCAMALAEPPTEDHPEGRIVATTRGTFEGRIGFEPRGTNGFGYDPLLVIADGRTSAELSSEEKNARSHRGAAARAMAIHLG